MLSAAAQLFLSVVVVQEVELLLKPVLAKYEAFDPKTLKDKDTRTQGCLVGECRNLLSMVGRGCFIHIN